MPEPCGMTIGPDDECPRGHRGDGARCGPDERAELARQHLAAARQTSVDQLPPSVLMRECA